MDYGNESVTSGARNVFSVLMASAPLTQALGEDNFFLCGSIPFANDSDIVKVDLVSTTTVMLACTTILATEFPAMLLHVWLLW